MTLVGVLLVAAVLLGIGVWGVLSQQSFVMVMMGFELAINGVLLAAAGVWRFASTGEPKGQVLVIVAMLVMAVEAAIGFALVVAVYRARQVDTTEGLDSMSS
jgi:NAD(P)H-quinone oxidoreductase subunit 4L